MNGRIARPKVTISAWRHLRKFPKMPPGRKRKVHGGVNFGLAVLRSGGKSPFYQIQMRAKKQFWRENSLRIFTAPTITSLTLLWYMWDEPIWHIFTKIHNILCDSDVATGPCWACTAYMRMQWKHAHQLKTVAELGLNSIVIDRGPNLGHLGHAPRALNGSRNLVHALSGPGSGYLGVHSKILLYFPTSGSFKRP